jgi:hypothetical protein
MRKFCLIPLLAFLCVSVAPAEPKAGVSASTRIDQLIAAQLREKEMKPNRVASDEVFVRRAYLDLVGRIPTMEEASSFFQSEDAKKREKLVEELIGSEGYVSHQYNYWADLLRAKTSIAGNGQSVPAGMAYERWIKNAIRENKPYDEMVYELVTATGSSWENPAIGYYLRDYGMPLDNLAITTQVFLGTQIVCAQCHDHPFDDWTQMDYYHLSAFTYPIVTTNNHPLQKKAFDLLEKRKGEIPRERQQDLRRAFSEILFPVRFNNVIETPRKLRLPHDYQYDDAKPKSVVQPATLMGNEAVVSPAKSTVDAFGEWLTSPENPRFTQVIANRLWKKAFGIGLIEPVDDIKEYTQASNPELMKFLEDLMIGLDYDLQAFQEVIYQTSAYQREAVLEEPVPGEPFYFAGPILRRMSAEQIWDSIVTLTVEDPDKPSAGRELLAERKIKAVELIASSIYEQSPGEFLQNGLEVAGIQKDLAVEIEAAQAKVQEAREAADPDLIKQASAEAREIRRRLYQLVEEKVYQKELTEKLAGIEKASLSGSESDEESSELVEGLASAMESEGEGSMMSMMSGSGNYGVIDRLVDTLLAEQKEALAEERAKVKNRRIKQWKIESKDDLRNYRNFAKIEGRMQRASDINSPAPPGHFLREFGQSDRELVENSSDQASVTQALAMLNGPVLGAVTSKYSTLARSMKGEAFKDRLDIIYLSMLSRLPTPEERAIFREAWTSDPGTGTVSGMVWTVLNTRQFLFIQ